MKILYISRPEDTDYRDITYTPDSWMIENSIPFVEKSEYDRIHNQYTAEVVTNKLLADKIAELEVQIDAAIDIAYDMHGYDRIYLLRALGVSA